MRIKWDSICRARSVGFDTSKCFRTMPYYYFLNLLPSNAVIGDAYHAQRAPRLQWELCIQNPTFIFQILLFLWKSRGCIFFQYLWPLRPAGKLYLSGGRVMNEQSISQCWKGWHGWTSGESATWGIARNPFLFISSSTQLLGKTLRNGLVLFVAPSHY